MGMFTTVLDRDEKEHQIKTGADQGETYKIGDLVNWWVSPIEVGYGRLLDGVYTSHHGWYVAIKNHRVISLFPKLEGTAEETAKQLGIRSFMPELWGGRAHAKHQKKQRAQKQYARRLRLDMRRREKAGEKHPIINRLIRVMLKQKSFMRMILGPSVRRNDGSRI